MFPRIQDDKSTNKNNSIETIKKEDSLISIDKFFDTEIKIGTIIEANEIKKSKKLLLLKIDIGSSIKTGGGWDKRVLFR